MASTDQPVACSSQMIAAIGRAMDRVSATSTLDELYPVLLTAIGDICGDARNGFLTIPHDPDQKSGFRMMQAVGRFSSMQHGGMVEPAVAKRITQQRELCAGGYCHTDQFVCFRFPHPEGLSVLAYVELEAPLDAQCLPLLPFFVDKVADTITAHALTRQAERTLRATVVALASLAEHKDRNTGDHILRVARITDEVVQVLSESRHYADELTPEFRHWISTASILHDVGKVAIPDHILSKAGALNDDERRVINGHTLSGRMVLEKARRILLNNTYLFDLASEIALYHHEHYNGSGYPLGLVGDSIPLSARIVALVDVYDALTSARPYKQAWSQEKAAHYVREQAGHQFDPAVVDALMKVLEYWGEATLITWRPAMSVKVESLDDDHRFLISLINQLSSAERIGNRRTIELVLDELVNYVLDHFEREEQFMQRIGYADLRSHQLQHRAFADTVQDIRWQYINGIRSQIHHEVLEFLLTWLSQHILHEDQKYVQAVAKEMGARAD